MDGETMRVQEINNDTVLEKTNTVEVKTRISLSALERRREYLVSSIEKFTAQLAEVDGLISEVQNAKQESAKG